MGMYHHFHIQSIIGGIPNQAINSNSDVPYELSRHIKIDYLTFFLEHLMKIPSIWDQHVSILQHTISTYDM
eukprot:13199210-Ditylum_brightwellii.AAC.1